MSIKIYVYGCTSCGVKAAKIAKARRFATIELYNSKYDEMAKKDHVKYLKKAGLKTSMYTPIVVDSDTITELETWKLQA